MLFIFLNISIFRQCGCFYYKATSWLEQEDIYGRSSYQFCRHSKHYDESIQISGLLITDYNLDHQQGCYMFCLCRFQHAYFPIAHVSHAARLPHSLKSGVIKFSKQQGCQVFLTKLTPQSIMKCFTKYLTKTCCVLSHIFPWLCVHTANQTCSILILCSN